MTASHDPREKARHSLGLIGFALAFSGAVFLAMSLIEGHWLIDGSGRVIANDFVNVWAAGKLALAGQGPLAYDWTIHREAEVAALGYNFEGYYGWHYPPPFLFAAAALAMTPYLVAMLLWAAATLPPYLAATRAIMGERLGLVLGMAFPGVMWNISAGQNGFLTAALIGLMLVNLTRRPVLAGVFLGLLTYKPQFGILFPVVLALDGRWRVIATATVTAAVMVALSLAVFGTESWRAFVEWMPTTSAAVFQDGRAGLNKLQSVFGAVRWLGGSMTAAWIAHGTCVAGAMVSLVLLWRRQVAEEIKLAALAVGSLLATPYLYIYDFPVLAIPLAFLLRLALREGFLPYELAGVAVACALVLAFPFLAMPTGLIAALLVAAMIARRAVAVQPLLSTTGLGKAATAS